MSVLRHHTPFLGCCLLAITPALHAAQDDAAFGDFEFDDSAFDDSSLFEDRSASSSPFSFRLSQQLAGHINRHGGRSGSDGQQRQVEINRMALDIQYQNAFGDGWLLQGSAYGRLHFEGDYRHRVKGSLHEETRLKELFLQRSGQQHSFSLGRQTIVWGETLANSVLDVINHTEYRDLTIIDLEDARRNQWLLNWDWFTDAGRFSSFVNLYPEFNKRPVAGSPLRVELPFDLPDHSRERNLFEVGTRWSRSFSGSDVALMAAWLQENDLHYLAPTDASNTARAISNEYMLAGLSANRAIGSLLLTLDLAFSGGLRAMALTPGEPAPDQRLVRRHQLGSSVGMEYAISNTEQFSLSVAAQGFLDRNEGLQAGERLLRDDINGNILMRYSNSLRNEDLLLSVTAQHSLDDEAGLLSLDADYRINDEWALMGQLILTRASPDAVLAHLHQDVRLGLTLRYSFLGR